MWSSFRSRICYDVKHYYDIESLHYPASERRSFSRTVSKEYAGAACYVSGQVGTAGVFRADVVSRVKSGVKSDKGSDASSRAEIPPVTRRLRLPALADGLALKGLGVFRAALSCHCKSKRVSHVAVRAGKRSRAALLAARRRASTSRCLVFRCHLIPWLWYTWAALFSSLTSH